MAISARSVVVLLPEMVAHYRSRSRRPLAGWTAWLAKVFFAAAVFVAAFFATAAPAWAAVAMIDAGSSGAALDRHVERFVDQSDNMDLRQVIAANRFEPTLGVTGWGAVRHPIWFRLNLARAADAPASWWLEIHTATARDLRFFSPDGRGGFHEVVAGGIYPFVQRPVAYRQYVYPVELPVGGISTVYVRYQSDNAVFQASIWQFQHWAERSMLEYLLLGACVGVMAGLALYNLLLFLRLREGLFILYFLAVGSLLLLIALMTGLGAQILWPGGYLVSYEDQLIVCFSAVMSSWFAVRLLGGEVLGRWFSIGMWAAITMYLAGGLAAVLGWRELAAKVFLITPMYAIPLVLFAASYRAIKGFRPSWYYLIGYGPVLAGISMIVLVTLGKLPDNNWNELMYVVAGAWEAIFFSQALAVRFNLLRQQKEAAQQTLLEEKTRRAEDADRHAAELEDKVRARTEELEASNAKLAELSATDGLTGIANRRRFDETLTNEWRRAMRSGQPLALVLLDVDWFKQYNDHYGHLDGDDCLRDIAQVIVTNSRRTGELVARYGGEEFALIAPATDAIQALTTAENICNALAKRALPHAGAPLQTVTISVGVSVMVPTDGQRMEILVKRADDALYLAKQRGRNQIVLAEDAIHADLS